MRAIELSRVGLRRGLKYLLAMGAPQMLRTRWIAAWGHIAASRRACLGLVRGRNVRHSHAATTMRTGDLLAGHRVVGLKQPRAKRAIEVECRHEPQTVIQ